MRLSDEGLNIVSEVSPSLKIDKTFGKDQQQIITEEDVLNVDAINSNHIVQKSPPIRKVSLPVCGLSF
jgi:hypothetical protein